MSFINSFLCDTRAFLWWMEDSPQLSPKVRAILANRKNEIYLSAASAHEIAIKAAIGKLRLPEDPIRYVPARLAYYGWRSLPVGINHAVFTFALPDHHRDPFDRLLVAQSMLEGMPLLTPDPQIAKYSVQTIWD